MTRARRPDVNQASVDHEDACFMRRVEGLFVGQLDDDELRFFRGLCRDGLMTRSYDGAGGLMGLAKAVLTHPGRQALDEYLAPRDPPPPDPQRDRAYPEGEKL